MCEQIMKHPPVASKNPTRVEERKKVLSTFNGMRSGFGRHLRFEVCGGKGLVVVGGERESTEAAVAATTLAAVAATSAALAAATTLATHLPRSCGRLPRTPRSRLSTCDGHRRRRQKLVLRGNMFFLDRNRGGK